MNPLPRASARRHRLPKLITLATLLLGLSPFAGCSASSSDPSASAGSGGTAGSAGSGGNGGDAGFGGVLDGGGSDAELPGCATESYAGDVIPLDIYVLLDRSDSMLDADVNGLQRWSAITQAIKNFVDLQGNAGIGLGLGYFPVAMSKPLPSACNTADDCFPYTAQCVPITGCCYGNLCNEKPTSSCLASDYSTPAIAVQALPGVGALVKQSIDATTPEGGTPMGPALEGAIDYAQTWAAAHPDHLTAVVLATDGAPSGCNPEGTAVVAARAEEGKNQNPSVLTFVIGLGEQLSTLNSIALAGGTKEATLVDSGVNAGQQFLDALNKIRGDLQCTYTIPTPKEGEVDPSKVNVSFTQAGIREFVPRVEGAANCGLGDTAGWYYDTPTNPSRITLCKQSCAAVQGGGVVVDVVLGCETVVK